MDKWPRALIFSAYSPESSVASAQVLERLLSGVEGNFGFIHMADKLPQQSVTNHLSYPVKNAYESLSHLPIVWRFEQIGWYQVAVHEGLKQTTESKWDVILACYPNLALTLAAARVAQITGLPLVIYLMDLFTESRVNPVEKYWARISEKKVMMQASSVICLTEGLQKHYSQKYDITPILISHCITESEITESLANKPSLVNRSPITVTYAGGVYQARLDSLLAVKKAIDLLNSRGYPTKLIVLGKNDPKQLATWGIGGLFVSVDYIEGRNEFMKQLRSSDILLSTIAFRTTYPLQDQTCIPTKTYDYFLAEKPVLVVAPSWTDYTTYMKKNSSADVVTTINPIVIAEHIYRLATDMVIREQLVNSGVKDLNAHLRISMQGSLNKVLVQSANFDHK